LDASTVRERLRQKEPLFGAWTASSDVAMVAAVASAGFDYVVIDLQHGAATEGLLPGLCASIALTGAIPMARARSGSFADVGRALDLGAQGVIVPNVDDVAAAAAVVRAVRYPPDGDRSIGRLHTDNSDPLCFIMVESKNAMQGLPRTLGLPGIDGIYVGPADLSLSLGCAPTHTDRTFDSAIGQVLNECRARSVPVGVHDPMATEVGRYVGAGCQLVNVFSDRPALTRLAQDARQRISSLQIDGGYRIR
jgi:4-hydroxy-2-oxoheptanedioate aldolase